MPEYLPTLMSDRFRGARFVALALTFAAALSAACSTDDAGSPGTPDDDESDCRGTRCADVDDGEEGDGDNGGSSPGGIVSCDENADCTTGTCNPDRGVCVVDCLLDAECGELGRCDAGACVARPPCASSADCSGGEICNTCAGFCTAAVAGTTCTGDPNCGFEEFCDTCVGSCRPRLELCDACRRDAECGESADRCLTYPSGRQYCGQSCGNCPIGYECGPDGQCVALSGDCEAVRQCTDAADCPRGQTCSGTFFCIPGCETNEACPAGTVCAAGACIPPCGADTDCPAGATCSEGRCRIPGGCLDSRDCEQAQTYCDTASNRCVAGCQTDVDCGVASLACEAGACVPRGCSGNFSCAFEQVCDLGSGQCVAATGPYCDTCNGDDLNSCGTTNGCLNLQDSDGNEQGSFCFVGCESGETNRCPQGYGCQEVDLGDEGIRELCVRNCAEE